MSMTQLPDPVPAGYVEVPINDPLHQVSPRVIFRWRDRYCARVYRHTVTGDLGVCKDRSLRPMAAYCLKAEPCYFYGGPEESLDICVGCRHYHKPSHFVPAPKGTGLDAHAAKNKMAAAEVTTLKNEHRTEKLAIAAADPVE